jgi:hypothetical protein
MPRAAHAQRDTTLVVGAHYARGGVHQFFFGTHYRPLWTTPVRVPILDLRTFAGGLTPTTEGGGFQTLSLYFDGADGNHYAFRSVDKRPGVLPVEVESTFVKDLVQDQISAGHPGSSGIVGPLLEAAGVPHSDETLVVLPQDSVFNRYVRRFGGVVGYLSRRIVPQPGRPGFAGSIDTIIKSRALFPRLRHSPDDLIDQQALLNDRLADLFLGDWDRHRGQWTWARFSNARPTIWLPLPEDRDQAFARFDGFLLGVARGSGASFLVNFSDDYADVSGQTWNGRDLDRWFLEQPGRAAWDSTASALQARLTDSVIDVAVHRMPDAWFALNGEQLARALRARRDHLPAEARRYYRMLAREAEVHATAADEDVAIERLAGGDVRVSVARRGDAAPWFVRTYQPDDTREVRIYLRGGTDHVVARGSGRERITVRVIGDSASTVQDSSDAGGVKRYDPGWTPYKPDKVPRISGLQQRPGAELDEPTPARDWGGRAIPLTWVSYGPDLGVFVGAGLIQTNFGFRRQPFASRWRLRGGWAAGASEGRVALDGTFRFIESPLRAEVGAYASGLEVVRWNGAGNATTVTRPDDYYLVDQAELEMHARIVVPVGRHTELHVGPSIRYSHTRPTAGRIIADSLPYGSTNYSQSGLTADLVLAQDCCWRPYHRIDTHGDTVGLDSSFTQTHGLHLSLGGSAYPAMLALDSAYGEVHGEVSGMVTATRAPLRPALAVRAGGKKVFGSYPFTEAAFIGDASTVRLGAKNRYAGDAAAWGNVELRLRLTPFFVVLPGELGVFGLADAGRVFVQGESSEQWHSAVGGGLWISLLRPANVLSVAVARSAERTAVYFGAGFAF